MVTPSFVRLSLIKRWRARNAYLSSAFVKRFVKLGFDTRLCVCECDARQRQAHQIRRDTWRDLVWCGHRGWTVGDCRHHHCRRLTGKRYCLLLLLLLPSWRLRRLRFIAKVALTWFQQWMTNFVSAVEAGFNYYFQLITADVSVKAFGLYRQKMINLTDDPKCAKVV